MARPVLDTIAFRSRFDPPDGEKLQRKEREKVEKGKRESAGVAPKVGVDEGWPRRGGRVGEGKGWEDARCNQ